MTRIRKHGTELTPFVEMALLLGPLPVLDHLQFTDEGLEFAWSEHGEEIMGDYERRWGCRPWAWWRFTIGEEPPPLEPGAKETRLAEGLGSLLEQPHASDLPGLNREHERAARVTSAFRAKR